MTHREQIRQKVRDSTALWPESKMPVLGIPDRNIRNIVAFLTRECTDPAPDKSTVAEQIQLVKNAGKERGRELVVKQGRIGCHARIEGVAERGTGCVLRWRVFAVGYACWKHGLIKRGTRAIERRSSLVGLVRPAFIAVGPPPYASSATCVDRMSTLALPCLLASCAKGKNRARLRFA